MALTVQRIGGALRQWTAAAGALGAEAAAREAAAHAETTRMVRSCYATDKLGIALGVSGSKGLAVGWWRWR